MRGFRGAANVCAATAPDARLLNAGLRLCGVGRTTTLGGIRADPARIHAAPPSPLPKPETPHLLPLTKELPMKFRLVQRRVELASLGCMLALLLTHCSDDSTSSPSASAGEAGASEAGSSSAEAGQASVLVCGQPTSVSTCDPLTGSPCDLAAGETCDHSGMLGGFMCFPGPNSAGPGETCDNNTSFCGPTTACNVGLSQCEHYCCGDSDCTHGFCTPKLFVDGAASVGICDGEYAGLAEGGAGPTGSAGAGG